MATSICPNCKADSFTWTIDEEETLLTRWGCYICGYVAFEDETFERMCNNCNKKTEHRLEEASKQYWWCSNCNALTKISEA